jgi:hypothetical protein
MQLEKYWHGRRCHGEIFKSAKLADSFAGEVEPHQRVSLGSKPHLAWGAAQSAEYQAARGSESF